VICRSGTPVDLDDLEIVSPHAARSIIVLPPEEGDPDSYVIKTILAIVKNPNRHARPYHIVTQIATQHGLDVIRMIGAEDTVHAVLLRDQMARMVAQTSRQSGLSVIYTDLLNFSGSEIYFGAEPRLMGRSYAEALLAFPEAAVIGLQSPGGTIRLNPPVDTLIAASDRIIAISEDEDAFKHFSYPAALTPLGSTLPPPQYTHDVQRPLAGRVWAPERDLILGWNSKAPLIIEELGRSVVPGSELLVVSAVEIDPAVQAACSADPCQRVTFLFADAADRQVLNRLDIPAFQHIIVLAYEGIDGQAADARTMITLLHLRNILEHIHQHCPIVSEMVDLRNRRLAEAAHVDDFIVSGHLSSLMLAQFSENPELYHVFAELFHPVGPKIQFNPVGDYIDVSQPALGAVLVEAAYHRGETAIGYRLMRESDSAAQKYGIYLNPKKAASITFSPDDKLIVLTGRR
jgi:hypothetical protein